MQARLGGGCRRMVLTLCFLIAAFAGVAQAGGRVTLRPAQGTMKCAVRSPALGDQSFALCVPETIGSRDQMLLNFPEVQGKLDWSGPDERGVVSTSWTTEGRISYALSLIPGRDYVDAEMTVSNLGDEVWHDVFAFNCLNPTNAPEFKDMELERTFVSIHGEPRALSSVELVQGERPLEFYPHQRTPWTHIPRFMRNFQQSNPTRPDGSWMVTLSKPEAGYIAAASLASTFLFENREFCCIHAPTNFGDIGPGESSTTLSRFYLAKGDLEDFLERYRQDRAELEAARDLARPRPPEIRLSGVGTSEDINITGATAPGGRKLGPIAFKASPEWMDGYLLMRFPETLSSSMGLHFIDHHRSDMPPLSELERPEWHRDEISGEIRYQASTAEGVEFAGRVRPYQDEVYMDFRVTNNTDRELRHVGAQMCLTLSKCSEFSEKNTVETTYTWIDGKYTSLSETTPTPAEMGRAPWLIMLNQGLPEVRRRSHPDGWWVIDQRADHPVIARQSSDGTHLAATWWEGAPGLMTNTTIPCMHSRMPRKSLAPGETGVWHGKIYLMQNRPEELLQRYRGDSQKLTGGTTAR